MSDHDTPAPLAEPESWPEPTPEQVDLVRRVLAPYVHRARAEHAEQPSAA
ncbi:hypothetical protein [Streptomyces echinatus]